MLGLSTWEVGVGANLLIGGCYLTICWLILRGLLRSGQLRTNPLAAATALIFFTCAVHHAGDAIHAIAPAFSAGDKQGLAARAAITWQMNVWDLFGAGVAVLYLSLRSSFGQLIETPAMFADLERERIQHVVADERAALAEAQAVARLGSYSVGLQSGEVVVSQEYLRLFGTSQADIASEAYLDHVHVEDRPQLLEARRRLFENGEPMDLTFRLQVPGREEAVLHAVGHLEAIAGSERRITGTVQDITDLERARRARSRAEARFEVAFEQGGVATALIALDPPQQGRVLDANPAYAQLVGVELTQLVGSQLRDWVHPDDLELGLSSPLGRLAEGASSRVQFERRLLRDGRTVSTLVTDAVVETPGEARVVIEQAIDISERKRFESELRHLADHDALTGLFNRRRFEEELERALAYTRRYGTGGAVLALDLDGFKYVNDSLGHAAGDQLVTRLGSSLSRTLRETDVVARTGGDEFAVILPGATESEALGVAEKLLEDIRTNGTVVQGNRHAQVTGSVGVTLFGPTDAPTGEDLMVEADIAMYDAKAAGKDRVSVYQRGHQRRGRSLAHQDWIGRLRRALADDRLVLWAQPIVPVCAPGAPRFELLLRMLGDDGDLIPPGAFLYNAERFGFIEQIDAWVLEQAVTLLETHHRVPDGGLCLAVNVSARTLNGGTLIPTLERLLADHPIPAGSLTLEITETAAIANIDEARDLAREVRRMGAKVALDDFGAGFATFYYLKHLTFDYVKIDGEFIRHLTENRTDQLVVSSVVDIARGLGADTIAEFVQDDATLVMLRELGVGYAQGYHTGRPGPLDHLLPTLPAELPPLGPSGVATAGTHRDVRR